ncbi:MAG: redoxin domain-containing protein [Acidobacteriaceae bacterium]
MKRALALLVLSGCVMGSGVAQVGSTLPKVGSVAPALSFTKVLHAPAGERVSLRTMRGRVVVLEFWATWCAPCVGEIPVLNALASSLDPKKVQFISVDDEDPKVVEAFLKRKPIDGWVGLDGTGGMFKRYGVDSRPATVVIGPDGRVVSNSVRPEALQREKLLELAAGKKTEVGGKVDAKVQAQLDANVSKAFAAEIGSAAGPADALFDLRVSAAEKSAEKTDTHVMMMGKGKLDITHADVKTLLSIGAGVAEGRLKVEGKLPDGEFNLHVNAPGAEKKELDRAVEMAVAAATGVRIEHETKNEDALVLTALPDAKGKLAGAAIGFAAYQKKTHMLRCLGASVDQVASALEEALGKPVVNETSLTGSVTMDIPLAEGDVAAANEALGKALGWKLTPALLPIERVVVKAAPAGDGKGVASGS